MRDKSLKDEMRDAIRGDRERAEARRKAEAEGAYMRPAPPRLDLNRPARELKLPARTGVEKPAIAPLASETEQTEADSERTPPQPRLALAQRLLGRLRLR